MAIRETVPMAIYEAVLDAQPYAIRKAEREIAADARTKAVREAERDVFLDA
jgi:hypothetical protein